MARIVRFEILEEGSPVQVDFRIEKEPKVFIENGKSVDVVDLFDGNSVVFNRENFVESAALNRHYILSFTVKVSSQVDADNVESIKNSVYPITVYPEMDFRPTLVYRCAVSPLNKETIIRKGKGLERYVTLNFYAGV